MAIVNAKAEMTRLPRSDGLHHIATYTETTGEINKWDY